MNLSSKIYIAGHRGLAGSAIVRELQCQGYTNLVTRNRPYALAKIAGIEVNIRITLGFLKQKQAEYNAIKIETNEFKQKVSYATH